MIHTLYLLAQEGPQTVVGFQWEYYAQTLGYMIIATLGMGIALIITLKVFTYCTKDIDEWKEIREGNMACAVVLASVIIALGMVVAATAGS